MRKSALAQKCTKNNYVPHLNYQNKKNRIFKSKKIGKTSHSIEITNPEPLVFKENIFFNDLNGNIYKYSIDTRKLIWKFNFYKKRFKNIPIKINSKIVLDRLVVSDSLGYFYNINNCSDLYT